jgi:hypothetical protein
MALDVVNMEFEEWVPLWRNNSYASIDAADGPYIIFTYFLSIEALIL